jgi:hypothetical protein
VSIVANYIKERTKNAQFIVISLRNNMSELAARLVGVYKVSHMTKSVTIENRDYVLGRPRPGHGGQGPPPSQGGQRGGAVGQQTPGQHHRQGQGSGGGQQQQQGEGSGQQGLGLGLQARGGLGQQQVRDSVLPHRGK